MSRREQVRRRAPIGDATRAAVAGDNSASHGADGTAPRPMVKNGRSRSQGAYSMCSTVHPKGQGHHFKFGD